MLNITIPCSEAFNLFFSPLFKSLFYFNIIRTDRERERESTIKLINHILWTGERPRERIWLAIPILILIGVVYKFVKDSFIPSFLPDNWVVPALVVNPSSQLKTTTILSHDSILFFLCGVFLSGMLFTIILLFNYYSKVMLGCRSLTHIIQSKGYL